MSGVEMSGFRFQGRGLGRVLGSLEFEVMDAIWRLGPSAKVSIRDVTDRLRRRKPVSFNAVMTVMNRLADKGLLRRTGSRGPGYLYSARLSREAFEQRVSRRVAESLVRDFGSTAVAQFVDAVNRLDPDRLAEIERLLKARRGRKPTVQD